AALRAREQIVAQVGRVDPHPIVNALFVEHDGERVRFFAGRTPRVPDPDERIRSQKRNDLLAKRAIEGWVAKHRGGVHADERDEALHQIGLAQKPALQHRQRSGALAQQSAPHPTSKRWPRIVAEIVAPASNERVEEQFELELFDVDLPLYPL